MRYIFVLLLITSFSALGGECHTGSASWYGAHHHGRTTASGEPFDMNAMTTAHKTLPFGTMLEVENLTNGKSVEVRVNDRGPFIEGRVLDLSRAAMGRIGGIASGVVAVRYCIE